MQFEFRPNKEVEAFLILLFDRTQQKAAILF